ncbi:MAG: IS1595 family transposase, partial [Desulfovibrio sp.]|nr:IS1595 family transposase [Desulfovibrio sp.]
MPTKNRYSVRSGIPEAKIRQIVKLLTRDLNAPLIADLTEVNHNTVNRYLAPSV